MVEPRRPGARDRQGHRGKSTLPKPKPFKTVPTETSGRQRHKIDPWSPASRKRKPDNLPKAGFGGRKKASTKARNDTGKRKVKPLPLPKKPRMTKGPKPYRGRRP